MHLPVDLRLFNTMFISSLCDNSKNVRNDKGY